MDDELTPYEQGRKAASRCETFRDHCPYLFQRSGLSPEEFNLRMRPQMDEWFRGWKDWLDEHGLGFNMEPKRGKGQ
jgi:hypothetical protein